MISGALLCGISRRRHFCYPCFINSFEVRGLPVAEEYSPRNTRGLKPQGTKPDPVLSRILCLLSVCASHSYVVGCNPDAKSKTSMISLIFCLSRFGLEIGPKVTQPGKPAARTSTQVHLISKSKFIVKAPSLGSTHSVCAGGMGLTRGLV